MPLSDGATAVILLARLTEFCKLELDDFWRRSSGRFRSTFHGDAGAAGTGDRAADEEADSTGWLQLVMDGVGGSGIPLPSGDAVGRGKPFRSMRGDGRGLGKL